MKSSKKRILLCFKNKILHINIIIIIFVLLSLNLIIQAASADFAVRKANKILTIYNEKNPFALAEDIAINQQTDTIFVPNNITHKVLAYSADGNFLFELGGNKGEEGSLNDIKGLCIDSNGKIYVVSQGDNQVHIFSPEGNFLFKFKTEPRAFDVVTSSKGEIIVSVNDFNNPRILFYDNEGKYKFSIRKIGLENGKKGSFGNPTCLSMTSDDRLIVMDIFLQGIFIFDMRGKLIKNFGGRGDVVGKFFSLSGVAVDNKDRIYLTDKARGIIQIFTRDGEFLSVIANEKGGPLELTVPSGLAFDSKQRLYCHQEIINRLAVFEFIDK